MFTLANEGSTTEQVACHAASSGRCDSAGLVLFLQLKRFAAAFERAGGRAPARVRTALLALAYNLELETTVLTHVDLPQFHLYDSWPCPPVYFRSFSRGPRGSPAVASSVSYLKPEKRSVSSFVAVPTVERATVKVSCRNHGFFRTSSGVSPKGAS